LHSSAIPTIQDLGGLIAFILGNPYLFLSSTTWMTSALIIGAAVVSVLPRQTALIHRVAPTLAIILAYFGVGSFVLSLEILLRFHHSMPYQTEVQFVSGIAHLVEAFIGLVVLYPHLRHHTRIDWLWAHNVALGYWTFQITVLTPPWFDFQLQRELVLTVALLMLLAAASINVLLWSRTARP